MMKPLALIPALLVLASCSAPTPSPSPVATVTVTASTSATPSPSAGTVTCEYPMGDGLQGIIISGWDLVKASRGASDHQQMVSGLMDSVKNAQKDEERGCKGAVESAKLLYDLSVLNAKAMLDDEGEDADYTTIMDDGNAWFETVGFDKFTFTMGENDLGA